ncbi:MAG TPA: hypothetical protein VNV65_09975 [Candidatus Solibacter sp.]|nr:hypothetical protein [Candidatus Solibacter sp.]
MINSEWEHHPVRFGWRLLGKLAVQVVLASCGCISGLVIFPVVVIAGLIQPMLFLLIGDVWPLIALTLIVPRRTRAFGVGMLFGTAAMLATYPDLARCLVSCWLL